MPSLHSLEKRVEALEAALAQQNARQSEAVLSLNEAASYLRCSYLTILRMIKDGRLPSYKMGRRVLVKRSDVEAYAIASPRKM